MQAEDKQENELSLIPNTPSLISFTRRGYMKRVPTSIYNAQRRGGKGQSSGRLRDADVLEEVLAVLAHDTLLVLAGSGRCYALPAYKVPETSRTAAGTAAVQVGRPLAGVACHGLIPCVAVAHTLFSRSCVAGASTGDTPEHVPLLPAFPWGFSACPSIFR